MTGITILRSSAEAGGLFHFSGLAGVKKNHDLNDKSKYRNNRS